jgi:hypothetical protein
MRMRERAPFALVLIDTCVDIWVDTKEDRERTDTHSHDVCVVVA